MALVGDIQLQDSAVKPPALDTSKKFSAEGLTATTAFAVTDAGAGNTVSTTGLITAKSSNDVNAWLQTTKADGNVSLYLSNDARPDWALKVAGTASDAFVIGNSTGANDTCQYPAFSIGTAGAVGVGKTGASNILDITYRNSSTGGIVLTEATNSIASKFISEASSGSIGTTTNSKFGFRTNSATVGAFDTSGNFGIGTDAPGATLDVRGGAIFNEAGGAVDFRIEGDTEANLFFVDGSTDRIGIGTATPAVLLDVDEGDASCASVLMCVNGCICAVGYLGEKQGHTIEDAGVAETQRAGLNFVVTDVGCVVDDSTNDATVVCINGANTCVPFLMCDGSTSDPIPLTGGSIGNQLANDSNPTLGGLMCGGGNSICAVNCITITGCYFGDGSQLTGVSSVPSSFSGDCTIIGCDAGGNVAGGAEKVTLYGANAGYNATTPGNIVVIGEDAALCMTTATDTVLIGTGSGRCVLTCAGNLALGAWSLYNECAGSFNTALGTCAGLTQKGATTNTFVGAYAGTAVTTGSGNVFVGYKAGCAVTGGNCCLIIGNGTCDLITGDFNGGIVSLVSCVGIGTASPATPLHIATTVAGVICAISSNTDGTWQFFNNSSTGGGSWRVGSSGSAAGTGAGHFAFLSPAGSYAMVIQCGGNVGIGAASPAKLLDITGDNNGARVGQVINQNGTHDAELQMHVVGGSGGGNYSMHVGGASGSIAGDWGLYDNDAAAYRMVVLSDGKIGIGSTSPDYPLSLYSSTAGTALVSYIRHTDNSNAASHAELYLSTGGASGGDPVVHYNNSVLNWYAGIDNSDSDKFKISPTQFGCEFVITCTGLVGIGASTPNVPLTINQTSDGAGIAIEYNTGANENAPRFNFVKSRGSTEGSTTIVADGDELGRLNWQGADGSGTVNAAYIRGFVDGTPGTNDMPGRLSFWTTADGANSPTERMTIKSDGSIGIATATPGPGLVTMGGGVAGTTVRIDIDGGSDNGKGAQVAFQSGGTDKFYIGDTASLQGGSESSRDMSLYTTSGLGIRFYTGGNNRRMDITSDGDLQMAAGSDITQASGNDMNFKVSVNRDIIFSDTAEIARFVGAGGKLGIGTTAPDGTLHVMTASAGSVTANSAADDLVVEVDGNGGMSILTPNTGVPTIAFGDPEDSDVGRIYYRHSSDSMEFYTNATEALRINNEGVLGIKTTPTSGWHTDHGVLQIGTGAFWVDPHDESAASNMVFLSNNLYRDSADEWRAIVTDEITRYYQYNGEHYFDTSDVTTAGAAMCNNSNKLKIANNGSVIVATSLASGHTFNVKNPNTSNPSGMQIYFAGTSSGDTTDYFYIAGDSGGTRAIHYSNGNWVNVNNSYGSYSDVKLKQDIVDAPGYWDDFKALQYRKFRLKEEVAQDANAGTKIGLIAQEIEGAFSKLVDETPDREMQITPVLDDDGNATSETTEEWVELDSTTKSIKYSVLHGPVMATVVQELQSRLEAVEAEIAVLKSA